MTCRTCGCPYHVARIDALEEALLDMARRDCTVHSPERGYVVLDSMGSSTYADALRLLADAGRVVIISEHGRRVIAREAV